MTQKFKPFEHEDLELKNQLIDYARSISGKEETDAQLACAMIYASFAEYMATHLLDNLRHLMYETTYREFAALIFVDQRPKKSDRPRTMGQTVQMLEGFGFPDKSEVMQLLTQISKSRNNLFHNFAKIKTGKEDLFIKDISSIREDTEELFTKVNTIYIGLQKILIPSGDITTE